MALHSSWRNNWRAAGAKTRHKRRQACILLIMLTQGPPFEHNVFPLVQARRRVGEQVQNLRNKRRQLLIRMRDATSASDTGTMTTGCGAVAGGSTGMSKHSIYSSCPFLSQNGLRAHLQRRTTRLILHPFPEKSGHMDKSPSAVFVIGMHPADDGDSGSRRLSAAFGDAGDRSDAKGAASNSPSSGSGGNSGIGMEAADRLHNNMEAEVKKAARLRAR